MNECRFAIITFEDKILYESDFLQDVLEIYELWEGGIFLRGIFDYEQNCYLDTVDIIDILGC